MTNADEQVAVEWQVLPMFEHSHVPDDYRTQASGYRAGWNDALTAKGTPHIGPSEALQAEVNRLNAIINTPQAGDFLRAVSIEAEHQRQRWGSEHDAGKMAADWYWLVGYLAGKALHAQCAGDIQKAEHHVITTAAALANWHHAMFGRTDMRPGIDGERSLQAAPPPEVKKATLHPHCDCENPEPASGPALVSMECPVHNQFPKAAPPPSSQDMVRVLRWKLERAAQVLEDDGDEHGVGGDLRAMLTTGLCDCHGG